MTTCDPIRTIAPREAVVPHGPWVVLQLTLVAVPRALFAEILRRIERFAAEAAVLGMRIESDETTDNPTRSRSYSSYWTTTAGGGM